MNELKLNDIVYIMRNGIVAKARIEEIIRHYTQEKEIVKYIVHVYGIKEHLTMDIDDLYISLDQAKEDAEKVIENTYVNSMANLKNATDEVFEEKEDELLGKSF